MNNNLIFSRLFSFAQEKGSNTSLADLDHLLKNAKITNPEETITSKNTDILGEVPTIKLQEPEPQPERQTLDGSPQRRITSNRAKWEKWHNHLKEIRGHGENQDEDSPEVKPEESSDDGEYRYESLPIRWTPRFTSYQEAIAKEFGALPGEDYEKYEKGHIRPSILTAPNSHNLYHRIPSLVSPNYINGYPSLKPEVTDTKEGYPNKRFEKIGVYEHPLARRNYPTPKFDENRVNGRDLSKAEKDHLRKSFRNLPTTDGIVPSSILNRFGYTGGFSGEIPNSIVYINDKVKNNLLGRHSVNRNYLGNNIYTTGTFPGYFDHQIKDVNNVNLPSIYLKSNDNKFTKNIYLDDLIKARHRHSINAQKEKVSPKTPTTDDGLYEYAPLQRRGLNFPIGQRSVYDNFSDGLKFEETQGVTKDKNVVKALDIGKNLDESSSKSNETPPLDETPTLEIGKSGAGRSGIMETLGDETDLLGKSGGKVRIGSSGEMLGSAQPQGKNKDLYANKVENIKLNLPTGSNIMGYQAGSGRVQGEAVASSDMPGLDYAHPKSGETPLTVPATTNSQRKKATPPTKVVANQTPQPQTPQGQSEKQPKDVFTNHLNELENHNKQVSTALSKISKEQRDLLIQNGVIDNKGNVLKHNDKMLIETLGLNPDSANKASEIAARLKDVEHTQGKVTINALQDILSGKKSFSSFSDGEKQSLYFAAAAIGILPLFASMIADDEDRGLYAALGLLGGGAIGGYGVYNAFEDRTKQFIAKNGRYNRAAYNQAYANKVNNNNNNNNKTKA